VFIFLFKHPAFFQFFPSPSGLTHRRPGDYRIRMDLGRADDGGRGLPSAVVDPWPGSWTPRGGGFAAAMAMARIVITCYD
jgi:hypothetical protein